MLHSSLFLIAGLSLAAAAPGPYGAVQAPAPIPARQTAGVQCRTEYTTVWDTIRVSKRVAMKFSDGDEDSDSDDKKIFTQESFQI